MKFEASERAPRGLIEVRESITYLLYLVFTRVRGRARIDLGVLGSGPF